MGDGDLESVLANARALRHTQANAIQGTVKDAQGNDLTRLELTPEGQAMYQKDLVPFIQANAQRIREVVKSHLDRQELADIEAAVPTLPVEGS